MGAAGDEPGQVDLVHAVDADQQDVLDPQPAAVVIAVVAAVAIAVGRRAGAQPGCWFGSGRFWLAVRTT